MFTPYTGYRFYRYRNITVQGVQLTIYNLKHVADWIRSNGGATAGMMVVAHGEICRRGIWLGTLYGDIEGAHEGDWMTRGALGFTPVTGEHFECFYRPIDQWDAPVAG